MFGKMMNRYYYGKSGKGDYTKEDLPQTRWQLFWEMLRVREVGWAGLSAKETGRIGGLIGQSRRRKP